MAVPRKPSSWGNLCKKRSACNYNLLPLSMLAQAILLQIQMKNRVSTTVTIGIQPEVNLRTC
jgi:hypothetical protein